MSITKPFKVIAVAVSDFADDNAMTFAAALAYYAVLSLAPLLLILMAIAGFLGYGTRQDLVKHIQSTVGPKAGEAIDAVIASAQSQYRGAGPLAFAIGVAALLLSATGFLGQLQLSLDAIWTVQAKPGGVLWRWLRKRLVSLVMILAAGCVLLASVVVSSALTIAFKGQGSVWRTADWAASLAIFVVLFAVIFKLLPDVRVAWRDVWVGALVTGALFVVGKYAIGGYLGYSGVGSSYGAAGSVVVLIVWIYYAALILFLGAEITQASARVYGHDVRPAAYASWAPRGKFTGSTGAGGSASDDSAKGERK